MTKDKTYTVAIDYRLQLDLRYLADDAETSFFLQDFSLRTSSARPGNYLIGNTQIPPKHNAREHNCEDFPDNCSYDSGYDLVTHKAYFERTDIKQ